MKTIFAKTLVAGLFAATLSTSALAADWDMPTPYPDATFHTVNINQFADDIKKATDGGLNITVHSAGSLIKHGEIKNAVRGGQVAVGCAEAGDLRAFGQAEAGAALCRAVATPGALHQQENCHRR